ncbi:hypothetical protein GCM10027053_44290 [Intrasporangium mesophilum]
MRGRHIFVAAVTAALLVPAAATTALAAPPGNDTPSGAVAITSVPTTKSQSTTEATTDALDASLNANCGAPVTNGSVWFTYTDTTGAGLVVDVSGSDFSAGAMIVQGDPTSGGELVACGPGVTATVGGPAGTTYYVMAFSDTPGVVGGNLVATFDKAPPSPTAALTVSSRASAYKDGSMLLSGTYACTNADFFSDLSGQVVQRVGRVKITGFFDLFGLECDGATHPWQALVTSDNGLFAGGKAANVSIVFACGLIECAEQFVEQKVQVSRNGK